MFCGCMLGITCPPASRIVYEPGVSLAENLPLASELTMYPELRAGSELEMINCPLYGLSLHPGSGGMRITGQVGPIIATPLTPESRLPPVPDPVEVAAGGSGTGGVDGVVE